MKLDRLVEIFLRSVSLSVDTRLIKGLAEDLFRVYEFRERGEIGCRVVGTMFLRFIILFHYSSGVF